MAQSMLSSREIDVHSESLRIRPLEETDFPLMLEWLTNERVLAYYGGRDVSYDMEDLKAHYAEPIGEDYCRAIIEFHGVPVGYCQVYRLDSDMREDYGYPQTNETVFAADQFIGVPKLWGCGIGTAYLRLLLRYLAEEAGADVMLVDPHSDNSRAIRAYEKSGFRFVRALPAHELFEGRRVDCLLMEKRLATRRESNPAGGSG